MDVILLPNIFARIAQLQSKIRFFTGTNWKPELNVMAPSFPSQEQLVVFAVLSPSGYSFDETANEGTAKLTPAFKIIFLRVSY